MFARNLQLQTTTNPIIHKTLMDRNNLSNLS
jgi:hypothetical protein